MPSAHPRLKVTKLYQERALILTGEAMKAKLKPGTCYMAGLTARPAQRNEVGVETGNAEIEQRFIAMAMDLFKIAPNRILIEERLSRRHVYFYHSRVAKQLAEIRSREERLFRSRDSLSGNYVAGLFDARGRFSKQGIYLDGISPQDEVMLANLGIQTRSGRVSNISSLAALAGAYSVTLASPTLRRPHDSEEEEDAKAR